MVDTSGVSSVALFYRRWSGFTARRSGVLLLALTVILMAVGCGDDGGGGGY